MFLSYCNHEMAVSSLSSKSWFFALTNEQELMQHHAQKKPLRETIDSRDYYMQNLFKLFGVYNY